MNDATRKLFAVSVAALACFGCAAPENEAVDTTGSGLTGNGAPSGAHYNLNIIGVSNPKTTEMTDTSRHTIFVPLSGSTKIKLAQGDFSVLDGNGTDGSAAFQLPNPDPANSGTTTYSVWARALGKPGGSASMQTCATDIATGELYCSVYASVMMRNKGGSQFSDVSRELLYVYADLDGDGKTERYPLFSDAMQDYFWQYSNDKLRVAQLRFYAVPSTVP